MKVLILTDNLDEHCGWGRYSWNIVKKLEKNNKDIKVNILVNRLSGKDAEKKIFKNGYNFLDYFKIIWKLRKEIKNHDIIHCFDGYPYAIFSYLANLGLNKKLIINGVGTYSVSYLDKGIRALLLRKAYNNASSILCISNYTKKRILEHLPGLDNIKTVYMGVDLNNTTHCRKEKINNHPTIVSVGALKHRKGQHVSIEAIKILKEKYPNITLNIIGSKNDKKYYDSLVELVKKYDLEKNVHFFSNISDSELLNFYKGADVFLMPSITVGGNFEGFGLVYLEANACGVPAIGTYNCGAEDAIKDSCSGYLVKQNDPGDIADKIIKILSNDDLYSKMSEDSIKWAKEFNWDKTASLYIKEYK